MIDSMVGWFAGIGGILTVIVVFLRLLGKNDMVRDVLSYEEAIEYLVSHKPSVVFANAAIVKEKSSGQLLNINLLYLDDTGKIVSGHIVRCKSVDNELADLFADNNVILVE